MIEILEASGSATVQDAGRAGHRHSGIGANGAMDGLALKTANLMLGNPPDAAVLEVPGVPLRLRFLADAAFALTGADSGATLGGRPLPRNWRDHARAGEELALGHARRGLFTYVALAGGIDVPPILGSRSTHLRGGFGGFKGRMLLAGDRLPIGDKKAAPLSFGVAPPEKALPLPSPDEATMVRVLPAADYPSFTAEAHAAFWNTAWRISSQSNRAGYRLLGPALDLAEALEMRSHGLVPGVIQGPAGGQPIIQLADAYTAGGYPKIGVVIEPDLWRVAQTPLGGALRFQPCTYDEALAAHDAVTAHLDRIRIWMATCGLEAAA